MALKSTALITADLNNWVTLNNTQILDAPLHIITGNMLNNVLNVLQTSVRDINDSTYNKVAGITISDVTGLVGVLASKEPADSTILKQSHIVNSLTSTSTTQPLSAAQGKVLKDLIDNIHQKDKDDYLAFGTANQVSALQIKTHLSDTSVHYPQTAIDHNNLINKGTNTHAQIDSHLASTSNPHNTTITQTVLASGLPVTKGIIYVANGTNVTSLSPGPDGSTLKVNSSQPTGLEWASDLGESNVIANLGSGIPLYINKTGVTLNLRSLLSLSSGLTITNAGNEVHFNLVTGSINHDTLMNAGSNTHAQIDTHIASTSNPHNTTLTQVAQAQSLPLTKGTIYVANGSTVQSLPVGINGQVLAANSSTASGLEWINATGEANTASNLSGTGLGIFDSKSGVDLRFKRLNAASSRVSLTSHPNRIDIDIVPSVIDHGTLLNSGTNTHAQIDAHIANTLNPHNVTKAQVGLSNVPNVDATNCDNHTSGSSNFVFSLAYKTKVDGIAVNATHNPVQPALTPQLTTITITDPAGTPDYNIAATTNITPWGFANQQDLVDLLYVVRNLQIRVSELQTRLQAANIIL